jgi:Flp pilus assembly protein TadD
VISLQKKSTWPRQAALVISDSSNIHMLLRELLRTYNWTIADSMPSVESAIAALKQGFAHLIVVDDTVEAPAAKSMRYLMTEPIGLATPTLCFTLEAHNSESQALARLGRPMLVEKPLTPAKFVPGFVALVRTWEAEPYLSLRQSNYHLMNGNEAQCLKTLLRLAENKDSQAIASQTLSLHLRRLGRIKEAETVLLNSLRRSPRELATMLLLADLYMHSSMPRLAHRLLAGARQIFPNSLTIVIDAVQAALMVGNTPEAIELLYHLQRRAYLEEEVSDHLARLLFAEGREAETEKILNNNRVALKKIQTGWSSAELLPLNATA